MKYRITVLPKEGYPTIYTVDKKGLIFYSPLRCSKPCYLSLDEVMEAIRKDKIGT